MKMNAPRRKLMTHAIDLLNNAYEKQEEASISGNRIVSLEMDLIKPYHDHPFHLYEGERLQDMVESIRKNGVLTPVIVRKMADEGYEMLAGHNRMNAAQLAGLSELPAIVKLGLTEEEALLYVVETNLIQRSFTDLYPSEQAAVLAVQYDKLISQGKRTDILRELQLLEGKGSEETSGLIDQKSDGKVTFAPMDQKLNGEATFAPMDQKYDSRGRIAKTYNLSSSSVARLLRINELIPAYKTLVDNDQIPLRAAVDLSYLPKTAQSWLYDLSEALGFHLTLKNVKCFREAGAELTEDLIREIILELQDKKGPAPKYQTVKLPAALYSRFFKPEHRADEIEKIIEEALTHYYAKA